MNTLRQKIRTRVATFCSICGRKLLRDDPKAIERGLPVCQSCLYTRERDK